MHDDLRTGLVRQLDLRQREHEVAVPVTDNGDDLGLGMQRIGHTSMIATTSVPSTIVQAPPEHPGKICTNKTSVSFPPSAGAKYRQELQYGSDEWQATYSTTRNTIEGFNGMVKQGHHEALDDPFRRQVRGYTAQYLLLRSWWRQPTSARSPPSSPNTPRTDRQPGPKCVALDAGIDSATTALRTPRSAPTHQPPDNPPPDPPPEPRSGHRHVRTRPDTESRAEIGLTSGFDARPRRLRVRSRRYSQGQTPASDTAARIGRC